MKTNVNALPSTRRQNQQTPSAENERVPPQRLSRRALLGMALALIPAAWIRAGQPAGLRPAHHPFSRLFVFGDSLSDTGNLFRLSGGTPPAPYFQGRFSNGRLWVEYLADALEMEIVAGDNYAVGGATTGFVNSNGDYPGLLEQVASFAAARDEAEARDALFTVWAGANDFFVALQTGQRPAELIANGVGNTVKAVQRLSQAGARHLLVVNLPDLGLTPLARGANLGGSLTQLSVAYNQALESALESLAAAGLPTIRVDAFATLREMVAHPAQFGFTNVVEQLIVVGGNAREFLFWDHVHPTTAGHAIFAEAAADSLISYFSARQGNGTPAARINCLNGLVNAWDNH